MSNRRGATRPYYRQSETIGWFSLMGISFVTGVIAGVTFTLFVVGL